MTTNTARLFLAAALALSTAVFAYDDFLDAYRDGYEKFQAGDFDQAETAFLAAAKLATVNSHAGPAWVRVAQSREKQEQWTAAADAYERAADLPLEDKPADQLRPHRHIQDALKALDTIYSRHVRNPQRLRDLYARRLAYADTSPRDEADLLKKTAESFLKEDEKEKAIDWLQRAVNTPGLSPADKSGHLHKLGEFFHRFGKNEQAITTYRENVALKGGHPHRVAESIRNIGDIILRQGDPSGARDWYTRILSVEGIRPDHISQAHAKIADTYRRERDYEKALSEFRKAAAVPELQVRHKGEALYLAAEILGRDMRRVEEAKAAFDAILALPDVDQRTVDRVTNELKRMAKQK